MILGRPTLTIEIIFKLDYIKINLSPTVWERDIISTQEIRQYQVSTPLATHSSILAWKIPWTEVPGRLQSIGSQKSDMTEQHHFLSLSPHSSAEGNTLQFVLN